MITHKELSAVPHVVSPATHPRFQQPSDCPVVHCSALLALSGQSNRARVCALLE